MKAYIMKSSKKVEPFGDFAGDCLIGNDTLTKLQRETFLQVGVFPAPTLVDDARTARDDSEHLIVGGNVYFTGALLREFIAASRKLKRNTVCALKFGVTTSRTMNHLQDVNDDGKSITYNLRYYPGKESFNGDCLSVLIDPDEFVEYIPVPEHISNSRKYLIPVTDKFIIQIDHWANLWAANVITTLRNVARLQKKPKAELLLIAAKAHSLNKWKILARTNLIGRDTDIHPTAHIEGSVIADGVRVGAGAIIRESIIGKNAAIGNSVTVEESVIGPDATILHGHILYSVLYPGVFSVAQMISASLIGKDCFIGSGVTLTDFRLDGKTVTVVKDGFRIDSQSTFLGCCLGHNVYLGSGCIVMPGRAIPNDKHIALETGRVITGSSDQEGFRLVNRKELVAL